jgi:hypothetical protein
MGLSGLCKQYEHIFSKKNQRNALSGLIVVRNRELFETDDTIGTIHIETFVRIETAAGGSLIRP